jgi:hypothetical protein
MPNILVCGKKSNVFRFSSTAGDTPMTPLMSFTKLTIRVRLKLYSIKSFGIRLSRETDIDRAIKDWLIIS